MLFADAPTRRQFRTEYEGAYALPAGDRAAELLDTIEDPNFPGAILPRYVEARTCGKALVFYAVVDRDAQWRQLEPLLFAAVGVTLTSFRRYTNPLRDDPVMRILGRHEFARINRFFTPLAEKGRVNEACDALLRLRDQLRRVPAIPREIPRSTEEVLRRFDLALLAQDRAAAEEAIAYLRRGFRLDTLNLHFLEVQLLATFGEWGALTKSDAFGSLVNTRRPPAVTAALVEALFHTHITPLLESGESTLPTDISDNGISTADPAWVIVDAFRTHVVPSSGTLFERPLAPISAAIAAASLLYECAKSETTRQPQRDWVLLNQLDEASARWPDGNRWVYDRVREALILADTPASPEPLTPVEIRLAPVGLPAELAAELDAARDTSTPATADRARTVLFAVFMAATTAVDLNHCRTAVSYVGRLSPDERRKLEAMPGYAQTWPFVSQFAGDGEVPSSWLSWLLTLPAMTRAQARATAEAGMHAWANLADAAEGRVLSDFTRAFNNVADDDRAKLFDGLPHLIKHLQADPNWPNPNLLPLYIALLEQLLLEASVSTHLCVAAAMLFEAILASDPDEQTYKSTVEDTVANLAGRFVSVMTLDWLVDLVDFTVIYPCQHVGARTALWQTCIQELRPFVGRLGEPRLRLLAELANILGQPVPFPAPREAEYESPASLPNGYTVGVYTTEVAVAQRVKNGLSAAFPNLVILADHSTVSTPSLVQLARTSHMLIVYWRKATHSATETLKRYRLPDSELVWAVGKGSSTILSEVTSQLRQVSRATLRIA